MPAFSQLWFVVLVTSMVIVVRAENMQLDVNFALTSLDAGGSDEFKSGNAVAIHYNYFLKNWLAADVGLMVSDKTLEQSRKDIVGDFRTSIQTQAILLGLKPRYKFSTPYEVYGRLGLQY